MNKWSKRVCFEGKPRSGQSFVLTNCARKSNENANYKRNSSKRKVVKNPQEKNIEVSRITLWRSTSKSKFIKLIKSYKTSHQL